MPKEMWQCEVCGEVHDCRAAARRCEESHVGEEDLLIVCDAEFKKRKAKKSKWPDSILLAQPNSAIGCYYVRCKARNGTQQLSEADIHLVSEVSRRIKAPEPVNGL